MSGSSRRSGDPALAPNWRTVLAVDALIGVAAMVAGAVLVWRTGVLGGVLLGVAGAAYVTLVARRARTWARRRQEAAGEPAGD